MRILLDEQLPRRLTGALPDHEVRTTQQEGWAGISNGELLRRAATQRFDVLVAPSNTLEDRLPLIPSVLALLPTVQPGHVYRIDR